MPLLIPFGHLHLTARQADDCGSTRSASGSHGEIMDESVKVLGHAAMAVHEVEHFVKEQQHWGFGCREQVGQRFGARRCRLCRIAQHFYPFVAGDLASEIYPRRISPLGRIPSVAHEHADTSRMDFVDFGFLQKLPHPRKLCCRPARAGKMIECRERMSLAPAELSDERKHRRRVGSLALQPAKHHADMLRQGTSEASARKELSRVAVVARGSARHHLLQSDSELVRVERPPLPNLLTEFHNSIPRVK